LWHFFYLIQLDAVQSAYAEARLALLPTFSEDAENPFLVYSARDIAGSNLWGSISRVTDACIRKHQQQPGEANQLLSTLTDRGIWYDCVKSILQDIALHYENDLSRSDVKDKIKTGILLNYLINFHVRTQAISTLRGDANTLARKLRLPVDAVTRFTELFCTPLISTFSSPSSQNSTDPSYAISKSNRDKCRIHALIVYSLAATAATIPKKSKAKTTENSTTGKKNYPMSVETYKPITTALQMDDADAANLYREAGFTVKGLSASLSVPLTFPTPRRGGAKGK
jgi:A49-like RNA polymerase I associated factor